MEEISVSVLIPTFRRSKLLRRVLDALTVQSIKTFEVEQSHVQAETVLKSLLKLTLENFRLEAYYKKADTF